MGRRYNRRRRHGRRGGKKNKFLLALHSAPAPTEDSMVIKWDIKKKTFDPSLAFDSNKAKGKITFEDLQTIVGELQSGVKGYRFNASGDSYFFIFCCCGFCGGYVSTLLAAAAGLTTVSGFMFYITLFACIVIGCVYLHFWNSKMSKRGKEINRVLSDLNMSQYRARGVELSTDPLGTYIKVRVPQNTFGGDNGISNMDRPAPMSNRPPAPPMFGARSPMPPRPPAGFGSSFRPQPPAYNNISIPNNQVSPLNPPPSSMGFRPIGGPQNIGFAQPNNPQFGQPYQVFGAPQGFQPAPPIQNIHVQRAGNSHAKF